MASASDTGAFCEMMMRANDADVDVADERMVGWLGGDLDLFEGSERLIAGLTLLRVA